METYFAKCNTIIDNEETEGKQFLLSQIKKLAKVLAKLMSCFWIIFSPWHTEFLYMCACLLNLFLNLNLFSEI